MLAMSNDDDQFVRPSFPSGPPEGSNYNLQLLSGIEACWLELPEMRPNIKKIRAIINSNLKSTYLILIREIIRFQGQRIVGRSNDENDGRGDRE
jgi:hypothetical protein